MIELERYITIKGKIHRPDGTRPIGADEYEKMGRTRSPGVKPQAEQRKPLQSSQRLEAQPAVYRSAQVEPSILGSSLLRQLIDNASESPKVPLTWRLQDGKVKGS